MGYRGHSKYITALTLMHGEQTASEPPVMDILNGVGMEPSFKFCKEQVMHTPCTYVELNMRTADWKLVFAGPVCWTGKMTEIKLNPTAKDQTTDCSCTNSEIFRLPVATFAEKLKTRKKPV